MVAGQENSEWHYVAWHSRGNSIIIGQLGASYMTDLSYRILQHELNCSQLVFSNWKYSRELVFLLLSIACRVWYKLYDWDRTRAVRREPRQFLVKAVSPASSQSANLTVEIQTRFKRPWQTPWRVTREPRTLAMSWFKYLSASPICNLTIPNVQVLTDGKFSLVSESSSSRKNLFNANSDPGW